jgi:hypothetical protein
MQGMDRMDGIQPMFVALAMVGLVLIAILTALAIVLS